MVRRLLDACDEIIMHVQLAGAGATGMSLRLKRNDRMKTACRLRVEKKVLDSSDKKGNILSGGRQNNG